MITRNLGGIGLVLAIILIVCVMWSHASAMSVVTDMVVTKNCGGSVEVRDTDGNVYMFFFKNGAPFLLNSTVKVEIDVTYDRMKPEHFILNDMFIITPDEEGGE